MSEQKDEIEQAIALLERCHQEAEWLARNHPANRLGEDCYARSKAYEFILRRLRARDFSLGDGTFEEFVEQNTKNFQDIVAHINADPTTISSLKDVVGEKPNDAG